MSKVIKNNDGVAVVEGTPAASLVKDIDKFFTATPPKRMAGDNIAQPIKTTDMISPNKESFNKIMSLRSKAQEEKEINPDKFESSSPLRMQREENSIAAEIKNSPEEKEIKREEAMNKTKEFKRLRFAERSAEEQEATRGAFISTLQT